MWQNKTVAVILPVSGPEGPIRRTIMDFDGTGFVDEIIVVRSTGTDIENEVKKTRARLITTGDKGFGGATLKGIKATKADLIIISEASGSFEGSDILKLLSYSGDFEMVFGSRTHVPLIEDKSQMFLLKRIVEAVFGKLISLLFICPPLTDTGCNYWLASRKGLRKIAPECKDSSEIFTTGWLLLAAKNKVKFIQIPVNFKRNEGMPVKVDMINQVIRAYFKFYYIWKVWTFKLINKKLNS